MNARPGAPVAAPRSEAESYANLTALFNRYEGRTEEWLPC
jgi:hypothetical protein